MPDDLKERLDVLSEKTRRPISVYVLEALEKYLENLEDYYLGLEALEQARKESKNYSLSEVRTKFSFENR